MSPPTSWRESFGERGRDSGAGSALHAGSAAFSLFGRSGLRRFDPAAEPAFTVRRDQRGALRNGESGESQPV